MAELPSIFNPSAEGQKGMRDFSPVPVGDYKVKIADSEMKRNKADTGSYLNIKWEILEGEFAGRFIWVMLNLENPNAQTVEIAQQELKTICDAVGVAQGISDSAVLHNIPCWAKVGIQAATAQFPAKNKMMNYAPLEGGAAPGAAASAMATAAGVEGSAQASAPVNTAIEPTNPSSGPATAGANPPTPDWGSTKTEEPAKTEEAASSEVPKESKPPWA